MADEMKKYLKSLMSLIEGLYAIIITDRDGVPVLKVADENTPDQTVRPAFLATFGMATEQASKLGLNKNKSMICMFDNYQVVHINKYPLMVTMIASSSANTGMMLGLENELDEALSDLKSAVDVA